MARELAPHGTEAAYRRHLRHAEAPCEQCKRGAAEARSARGGRKAKKKDTNQTIGHLDPVAVLEYDVESDLDIPRERRRLYHVLNTALPHAMPREVSSIVKEMRTLLVEIKTDLDEGGEQTQDDDLAGSIASIADRLQSRRAGA